VNYSFNGVVILTEYIKKKVSIIYIHIQFVKENCVNKNVLQLL